MAAQVAAMTERARVAVEQSLSKPQRKWLSALKREAPDTGTRRKFLGGCDVAQAGKTFEAFQELGHSRSRKPFATSNGGA
jgi:hypothetical protein